MARGPLLIYYYYVPILCWSLDRGWGPQSVSASAGAREDRRVGGSRWSDASESIRIRHLELSACHRVTWDPGILVVRIAYARNAALPQFRKLRDHRRIATPEHRATYQFFPSLPSPIDMLVGYLHFVRVYYPSCGRASHVGVTFS